MIFAVLISISNQEKVMADSETDIVIENIAVTGVVEPVIGNEAVVDGVTVDETKGYYVSNVEWYYDEEFDGEYLTYFYGEYERGMCYQIWISINAKEGYTFAQTLTKSATINGKVCSEIIFSDVDEITIYMNYEMPSDKHTLSFDLNGGSGTMNAIQVKDRHYYTFSDCLAVAPSGKEFAYYEIDGEKYYIGDRIYVDADINVKIVWLPIEKFTVSFDMGGRGKQLESIKNVGRNEKITQPDIEENEDTKGYSFGGYYLDKEYNDEFDFDNDIIKGNTTLYIQWNKIIYNIDCINVIEPVAGAMINNDFETKDDSILKSKKLSWYKGESLEDSFSYEIYDEIYDTKYIYQAWITLELKDGYAFADLDNVTAYINGKKADISTCGDKNIIIYYYYNCVEKNGWCKEDGKYYIDASGKWIKGYTK